MAPDWKRISEIFYKAAGLEPDERRRFLDAECAGSPEEREQVDQLLKAASTPVAHRLEQSPVRQYSSAVMDEPSWVGRKIGPYQILSEIGRGGMGVVYLAIDTRLDKRVAIKALPAAMAADPHRRARLRTEAMAAANLAHPGIATVHTLEEIGDDLFIVSEYVKGISLRQAIGEHQLRPGNVVEIASAVTNAVAFAHSHGVIHRDIKPDNVLLPETGGVKVVDFGLARFLEDDTGATVTGSTRTGVLLGTPAYMSPEQIRSASVDKRSDVFALGVTIYECATWVHPFMRKTVESTMASVLEDEVDLAALGSSGLGVLAPIVARAVAKDPAARYASAGEMAAALDAIRSSQLYSGPVPPPPPPPPPVKAWRIHHAVVSAIALVMLWPLAAARAHHPWMPLVFVASLSAAVFEIALRMNFVFLSFLDRATLLEQRRRWRYLLLAADVVLCAALALAAVLLFGRHLGFTSLFGATSLGLLVAVLVIEPTTTRTAFPEDR